MKKTKKKTKKQIEIDDIVFDSKLEASVYLAYKERWGIYNLTKEEKLKGSKLLNPRPESYEILPGFKRGLMRKLSRRVYTPDFIIKKKDWTEVVIEVKSDFTERDPVYRLRKFIFLTVWWHKLNFAELIQLWKKWRDKHWGPYLYKEYF